MTNYNNKYRDLVYISESAAEHNMDAILNEFFFFCTFSKGLPSQDFLYRKFVGKPYSKYPFLHALHLCIKGYARTLHRIALHYIISNGPIIAGEIESKTNVLIVSWLWDAGVLLNNRIDSEDRYFGSLGARMKKQGYNVQYLLFPVTNQVVKDCATLLDSHDNLILNSTNALPSLEDLTSSINSISKSFSFDMRINERMSYIAGFHSLRYIVARQLCEILTKEFKKSNISHIIIPWEGQPEQKAICLAAHSAGIKIWGYCHAAINGSYAHLINNDWKWCPDIMLVNGFGYVPLLEDMGWKDKTCIIRSLRHQKPPEKSSFEGKAFLPYDVADSIATLNELKSLASNGNFNVKEIRCHPINVNHPEINALIDEIPINQCAKDLYVGGFTSIIFEALQAGCTVYNIQNDILYSEEVYRKFDNIRVTRLNKNLIKLEPIGDMTNCFYCFDENMIVPPLVVDTLKS